MHTLLSDAEWMKNRSTAAIGVATFAILALELALIRWTSAQIRIFSYFNNIVLISAFLGIGLGVALGPRKPGLVHLALPLLLVLSLPIAFAEPLRIVQMRFPDQSIMLWGGQMVPENGRVFARNLGVFVGILSLVIATFATWGAALGALFRRTGTLRAYQSDLLGSLLGVLAFSAAAWLDAGPGLWLALACVPFLWLTRRLLSVVCAALVIGLAFYSVKGAIYSPYNRIDLFTSANGGYELRVNRDFHQYMLNLSNAAINEPGIAAGEKIARIELRQVYDLPFSLNPQRDRALIVGAGTGNDVQAALRYGYREVTSVDIDGRIIALGRQLHPEHPYGDPAVRPVVDDARAFFEKDRGRTYDVVCFGLLDSHAMSSAMSTLRLDNFVYTEEGIRAAWKRVAPGGHLSLALSCTAGWWFYERLHWTITRATGREPTDYYSPLHGGEVTFVVARDGAKLRTDGLATRTQMRPVSPREHNLTTSDDWPFLYLRPGVVPWGYIVVLAFIVVIAGLTVPPVFRLGSGGGRLDWPLFFMGAAFLLIETRGVTSLSLLFGSTWVVNSVVFAGILLMVLLGNMAVRAWGWNDPRPWFLALFAAVVLLCVFPIAWLHTLPLLARAVAGGLLTGLPIGVAGVIVPMLLVRSKDPTASLGANLLGSVLGGCFEYVSMYTGLQAVGLMALALYLVAFLLVRRQVAGTTEPSVEYAAVDAK